MSGSLTRRRLLTTDPFFVSATDLHLQSQGGRWDPGTSAFVTSDTQSSPCIDAGDPADDEGAETQPNGGRINMGAYGGTAEASRTVVFGTVIKFL